MRRDEPAQSSGACAFGIDALPIELVHLIVSHHLPPPPPPAPPPEHEVWTSPKPKPKPKPEPKRNLSPSPTVYRELSVPVTAPHRTEPHTHSTAPAPHHPTTATPPDVQDRP